MIKDKVLTMKEIADELWGERDQFEYDANLAWLNMTHSLLNEGGTLASPVLGKVFRRSGDGFVLTFDDERPFGVAKSVTFKMR